MRERPNRLNCEIPDDVQKKLDDISTELFNGNKTQAVIQIIRTSNLNKKKRNNG